ATGTASATGRSTTSAACSATARATCAWPTPDTSAAAAGCPSASLCPSWPRRAATTRGASSPWPCACWPRTACPTASPPGTGGATTASSPRTPPSRTGSRRRGKKGIQRAEREYLDEARAGFSGYLAVDERYDGPLAVLSAVDPHQQRRLLYEVLDHDPTGL